MTDSQMPAALTPESMDGASLDVAAMNRAQLKALFPSVFTETRNDKGELVESVDFEKLKAELGTFTDLFESRRERYGMDWPGKKDALKLIQTPTYATLKPSREESVNFDTTENLFIEGDNLEVLKLLQKSYYGKVKMIYIDPPYNTDGDFIYPDRFSETLETYMEYTSQVDASGKKYSTVSEEDGRYHSRWLSMMAPRLYLARNLLSSDGVIAIHIDEHEATNLHLLMREIFGHENDLGTIAWDKRNPKGDAVKIATQHESIIVFAKDFVQLKGCRSLTRAKPNADRMLQKAAQLLKKIGSVVIPSDLEEVVEKYNITASKGAFAREYTLDDARTEYKEWLAKQDVSGGEAAYKYIDEEGRVFRTVSMAWPNKKAAPDDYFIPLYHPISGKPCTVPERGWRNPPSTMKELLDSGKIIFGIDESKQPERKYLLEENMDENIPSVLPFGGSDDALLKKLGIPFENPKPVDFAKQLISYFTGGEGLVLDFFAGSSTTAHACLELASDDKKIRFIMIQLPELLDSSKAEQKLAVKFCEKANIPKNISAISKERLRRAIGSNERLHSNSKLGFRSFSLQPSFVRRWKKLDPSSDQRELIEQLELHVEHIDGAAQPEHLLYELLIKSGFALTEKISAQKLAGIDVYSVRDGGLLICLADRVTRELIDAVAAAEPSQFVCLDSAFAGNDQLKANAVQTFAARNQGRDKVSQIVFRTV